MNTIFQYAPLLMGAPAGDGTAGGGGQLFTTFITFGLVIAIFYFLIIRPQNKKQKETKRMLEAIKKGDRVATIGGIHGIVQSVKDDKVVLKVDTNTKLEFSKSAISTVLEQDQPKQKKKSEDTAEETETAGEDTTEEVEAEDGE